MLGSGLSAQAQQDNSFAFKAYPDLWYNTEDGLRFGVRFGVFRPLEYEDNHKLDLALAYATGGPESPLSYHASYRSIIWPFYGLDEPAFLTVNSFSRVGVQQHGLEFRKRFSQSFNAENYTDIGFSLLYEDRFEAAYLPYPAVWQNNDKWLAQIQYQLNRNSEGQSIILQTFALRNFSENSGVFSRFDIQVIFAKSLSVFELRSRISGFLTEGDVAPEHGLLPASRSFHGRLSSPFFRAEGLMPQTLLDDGLIHFSGGVNLRGYQEHEAVLLQNSTVNQFVFGRSAGINLELNINNPVQTKIKKSNITAAVLDFRTYLFMDAGHLSAPLNNASESLTASPFIDFPDLLWDAGAGLALDLNFPDFLGNRRGFIIRYDLPIWLSYPIEGDDSFAFRQVIGFGGILSF